MKLDSLPLNKQQVTNRSFFFFAFVMILSLLLLLSSYPFSSSFAQSPSVVQESPLGEIDSSPSEAGLNNSKNAITPNQKPMSGVATRNPFGGSREPAITPIELDVVRTGDGKLQIRSVSPQSKFATRVKQSQVFNNWDEIWTAIGETPEGEVSDTPKH